MQIALLISICIHLLLFTSFKSNEIKTPVKMPKSTTYRIRIDTRGKANKKKQRNKQKKSSDISWEDLQVSKQYEGGKIEEKGMILGGSVAVNLKERIEQQVYYPQELAKIGIFGKVHAKIYIDSKGVYHEKFSTFKSHSKYLEIHVRRILRSALNDKLRGRFKKEAYYSTLFEFDLTTGTKSLASEKSLYFYRKRYGVVTGVDKLNNGLVKVLSGLTNIFTLLEYLPSSQEEQKLKVKKLLTSYQEDIYWY